MCARAAVRSTIYIGVHGACSLAMGQALQGRAVLRWARLSRVGDLGSNHNTLFMRAMLPSPVQGRGLSSGTLAAFTYTTTCPAHPHAHTCTHVSAIGTLMTTCTRMCVALGGARDTWVLRAALQRERRARHLAAWPVSFGPVFCVVDVVHRSKAPYDPNSRSGHVRRVGQDRKPIRYSDHQANASVPLAQGQPRAQGGRACACWPAGI